MAQVAITINGRDYTIACDDGMEDHLRDLARYVDSRVQQLVAAEGQIGDTRLLVMASLLVADEVSDLQAQARQADGGEAGEPGRIEALSRLLEGLARRIEDVAARLERA